MLIVTVPLQEARMLAKVTDAVLGNLSDMMYPKPLTRANLCFHVASSNHAFGTCRSVFCCLLAKIMLAHSCSILHITNFSFDMKQRVKLACVFS